MKIIRDLFDQTRPIDRKMVSVINYAATETDLISQEISEYEVTDSLTRHYEKFITNLDAGFRGDGGHDVGVWVSGFYGSGKSSFTKYLGFALDPTRKVGDRSFLECFKDQIHAPKLKAQLATLAKNFPATVIMIDLASVASAEASSQGISRTIYHKVMEWAGYSKDEKISLLELMLERDGRTAEFHSAIETYGFSWPELKDDLLASKAIVSQVVSKLYPVLWPDEVAFSRLTVDSLYGEDERLKQILALIERRSGKPHVIFIIDEVGQFIEGTDSLINNLQGLAENLKNFSKGKAWIVATAQQSLPMTGPLFKLKDRFPESLRIDIESTDIREITYRRLLKKSPEALKHLTAVFQAHSGAITAATKLQNTKHIQTIEAPEFAQLYPFLPQHFNILMELLRSLARSTGGVGLRSTLKVIQDVTINNRGNQVGPSLADLPIGALATADMFFDTLRADIERANRPLVDAVNKVEKNYRQNSLHHRIAKTIAVLQLVEGFPVSPHNVAAMLHPAADATPNFEDVAKAAAEMCDDKELPLENLDGSLRFMNEAVSIIITEQGGMQPTDRDQLAILNEILRDQIFSPEPTAKLENTKNVKSQVKLLRGDSLAVAITHSKEDLELHIELVFPTELAEKLQSRTDESRIPLNKNVVYLLGEDSTDIRKTIVLIYQCEEIYTRHRTEAAEKEIAQFITAQKKRAEDLRRKLTASLQDAFLKGSFIFRGTHIAVANRGLNLTAACNAQLNIVAVDVFPSYKQASQNVDTLTAEKLLLTQDLSAVLSTTDPLTIVEKAGTTTRINPNHPALVSLLDYLETRGEVDGRKLLEDFNNPPYGWFKDTTRYLVAGLLISQSIRIKVASQWIESVGPIASAALKNNATFLKIAVANNNKQIPQETLNRAARRLLELTGERVLALANNISRSVLHHFPLFRSSYGSLAVELKSANLPGTDRAQSLSKSLAEVLDRDASDAPLSLGAEQSQLNDDLLWARDVRKSLDNGLGTDSMDAQKLSTSVASLPKVGSLEKLIASTDSIRSELADFLSREKFYEVAAEIRSRLTDLRQQVSNAASAYGKESLSHHEEERLAITS
ncbi:MAG: BREX system P-loop protein BrxC, partial [Verrucomicrobiota bacterium]